MYIEVTDNPHLSKLAKSILAGDDMTRTRCYIRMLTYAGVCWRMLTYADAKSIVAGDDMTRSRCYIRMLTYAGVC